ncbi:MAG: ketoacyl-ACP synthase III [Anaerolineales bacterium]|nr:ketoacyl-ACP synthase III [Anaerolineales bacterium]
MNKPYGRVIGWGKYVPETVITNHDLEKTLDTSHDWIVKRTGIHSRRVAAEGETTSSMAIQAARQALETADLQSAELDLIIMATNTPDHLVAPSPASLVQQAIGAADVPAFSLSAGCTGFIYALSVAQQFISAGVYQRVLVIGAELLSRFVDWEDRRTAVLFGDGAGAVILQATAEPCGPQHFVLGSDGQGAEHIMVPAGGAADPFSAEVLANRSHFVTMNGSEVFKFATRKFGDSCRQVLAQAHLDIADIDWVVSHQANERIIKAGARDLGVPLERCLLNVGKYGNTSTASIPILLCESIESGHIQPADKLLLVAFGAGLTWGACLLQLAPVPLERGQHMNGLTSVRRAHRKVMMQG